MTSTIQRTTLASWREPNHRGWSFTHLGELIPTQEISRGDHTVPLAAVPGALGSLPLKGVPGKTLDEQLVADQVQGFLVVHRGVIVFERYTGFLRPGGLHSVMSISKSIVATVTGILCGQGLLQRTDLVAAHLPELRGTAWQGARIADLLDMRAGIEFDESLTSVDAMRYDQVYQWRPYVGDVPGSATDYMRSLRGDRCHGGGFRYQSILTDMLGWVLERVTGCSISELISNLVWRPIGAEVNATMTIDRYGNALADGGICASMRDLARFGELWRRRGRIGNRQVVPQSWIADTLSPPAWIEDVPDDVARFYRNNWWILDPDERRYAARGFGGQMIAIDELAETTIVMLSAWDQEDPERVRSAASVARQIGHALVEREDNRQ